MTIRLSVVLAGLALASEPAAAQQYRGRGAYERGYSDWQSPRSAAISRSTAAETARANARAAAELEEGWPIDEAGYARDMAAYGVRLRAHGRANADVVQRQRAYAMAMDAWQAQVDACEAGDRQACAEPAPEPADYMRR